MEIVWLRVPGCQVCNRKRPTAELGVTVSWHDELMSTCTAETLATCLAAVDEVPRSVALQTPMNSYSELKLDTLRNIQSMALGVKQMRQAAVKLVSFTDDPSCSI